MADLAAIALRRRTKDSVLRRAGSGAFVEEEVADVGVLDLDSVGQVLRHPLGRQRTPAHARLGRQAAAVPGGARSGAARSQMPSWWSMIW